MKGFKDIIRNELQSRAVKNAVKELLDNIGTYIVDKQGRIVYHINTKEIDEFSRYEFKFPGIDEIIAKAKSLYSNFDSQCISSVCYVFENVDFYRKAIILSSGSDVVFSKCKFFDGLTIAGANNIFIINNSVCSSGMNIKTNNLKMNDFKLLSNTNEPINIISQNIDIRKSALISESANVSIDSDSLIFFDRSSILSKTLCISVNKLEFDEFNLRGKENIEIHYKDYDVFSEEKSSNDVFAEADLRAQLIESLNVIKQELIKDDVQINVDNKVKMLLM